MGKLHTIGAIEIRVFGRDHRPAHVHVIHPDFEALVDVATLTVLRGTIPARDRHAVMDWAAANHGRLVAEWNRLNPDLAI